MTKNNKKYDTKTILENFNTFVREKIGNPEIEQAVQTYQNPHSGLLKAFAQGAPLVRVTKNGSIYDFTLKNGKISIQQQRLQPVGEPFEVNTSEELDGLELNWNLEKIPSQHAWVPGSRKE